MSQCRALTNFIANGVITLAVARWENELDETKLHRMLDAGPGKVEKRFFGGPENSAIMPATTTTDIGFPRFFRAG